MPSFGNLVPMYYREAGFTAQIHETCSICFSHFSNQQNVTMPLKVISFTKLAWHFCTLLIGRPRRRDRTRGRGGPPARAAYIYLLPRQHSKGQHAWTPPSTPENGIICSTRPELESSTPLIRAVADSDGIC